MLCFHKNKLLNTQTRFVHKIKHTNTPSWTQPDGQTARQCFLLIYQFRQHMFSLIMTSCWVGLPLLWNWLETKKGILHDMWVWDITEFFFCQKKHDFFSSLKEFSWNLFWISDFPPDSRVFFLMCKINCYVSIRINC